MYAEPPARRLTVDEYAALVADFRALGGQHLVISGGGEPTLFPGFVQVLASGAEQGLSTHVYTNAVHAGMFTSGRLADWLPSVTSLRVSLHTFAAGMPHPRVWLALAAVAEATTTQQVSVAIFPQAFSDDVLREIAGRLSDLSPTVKVELRLTLPAQPDAVDLSAARSLLIAGGIPREAISTRGQEPGIPGVPRRCAAVYRSITVDPYGGIRVCCMRAHLPWGDPAHVGNTRTGGLVSALDAARRAMNELGRGTCTTCAQRDSAFSELALTGDHDHHS